MNFLKVHVFYWVRERKRSTIQHSTAQHSTTQYRQPTLFLWLSYCYNAAYWITLFVFPEHAELFPSSRRNEGESRKEAVQFVKVRDQQNREFNMHPLACSRKKNKEKNKRSVRVYCCNMSWDRLLLRLFSVKIQSGLRLHCATLLAVPRLLHSTTKALAKRTQKSTQVNASLQNQNLRTDLRRVAKRIRKSH